MPDDRESPVAIITGAGSGIGRATALRLARAGFSVVLVGRRIGALEETLSLLPEGAVGHCLSADIGDTEQAAAIVGDAVDRFGRLDVLVNNAALAPLRPIEKHDAELIEEVFAVNAVGPACTIAAAWKVFRRQAADRRRGPAGLLGPCIVNVSTMGTMDPFPGFFAYAASKAAMNLMVKSCAAEGRDLGIRAFAVAPGAVETDMLRALFDESILPRTKTLTPERVADEIVACILSERADQNGKTIYLSAERGVIVV